MMKLDPALFAEASIPPETRSLNEGIVAAMSGMAEWWDVGAQKVRDARARGEGAFPAAAKSDRARWIEIDGPAGTARGVFGVGPGGPADLAVRWNPGADALRIEPAAQP